MLAQLSSVLIRHHAQVESLNMERTPIPEHVDVPLDIFPRASRYPKIESAFCILHRFLLPSCIPIRGKLYRHSISPE
jgi:hypothetical protein